MGGRVLPISVVGDAQDRDSHFGYLNAGLGGYGRSSEIDGIFLHGRDANPDGIGTWSVPSDDTLKERVHHRQT